MQLARAKWRSWAGEIRYWDSLAGWEDSTPGRLYVSLPTSYQPHTCTHEGSGNRHWAWPYYGYEASTCVLSLPRTCFSMFKEHGMARAWSYTCSTGLLPHSTNCHYQQDSTCMGLLGQYLLLMYVSDGYTHVHVLVGSDSWCKGALWELCGCSTVRGVL